MHEQNIRVDDENLHTLFCEVEAILNGRPITAISDDINDLKVLTPNNLHLLRKGNTLPPGTFVIQTITSNGDGVKSSIYLTYFGIDGQKNTCPCFNREQNRINLEET